MEKMRKYLVKVIVGIVIANCILTCHAYDKDYQTECGITLSQSKYNELSNIYSKDMIYSMPKNLIQNYAKADQIEVYDKKEIFVKVEEDIDLKSGSVINSNEKVVSKNQALSTLKLNSSSSTHKTAMKKITMTLSSGAISGYKTIDIKCEWLSLPQNRSYDLIGIRPEGKCTLYTTKTSPNYWGIQKTDVGTYRYSYGSNNIVIEGTKIAGAYVMDSKDGLGISMNLSDKATSISCEMAMTVYQQSQKLGAYGTYQHAQDDVTLKDSKRYSFNSNGLGNVFNLINSVKSKYDGTAGLYVN